MKQALINFLKKQSFEPGFAGLFVNPFFFIRRALYKNIKMLSPNLQGKLLDFGCGRKPYDHLFHVSEYIGIDMENTGHEHTNSKIDVFYDGRNIPFPDNSFDSVFCSEVFEHVFNLEEVLTEIKRVLKPGGKMLITVPFAWNEHEIPFDFARYTSFGIKDILGRNGFSVQHLKKSGNFVRVLFQLWSLYFYTVIETKSKWLNFILRMLFIIPINIVGSLLIPFFPRNTSYYFNNVVLAEKE